MAARLPGWTQGESFLAESLIDQRWASPDLSSLVAVDGDGAIVGFIGAQVRRFRFDDRSLTGVCASHLRSTLRAAAALPARSVSPACSLAIRTSPRPTPPPRGPRMCRSFRRPPRPCPLLRLDDHVAPRALAEPPCDRNGPPAAPPQGCPGEGARRQAAAARRPTGPARRHAGEDADAAGIVAALEKTRTGLAFVSTTTRPTRLPAPRGRAPRRTTARIVHRAGAPIGWYAHVPVSPVVVRVLHLFAGEQDTQDVLGELLVSARVSGAAVVCGRVEPHLTDTLLARRTLVGFARRPWIHTREPEIRAPLGSSDAAVTQLDSEWFVN